jgi:hypothetical protein
MKKHKCKGLIQWYDEIDKKIRHGQDANAFLMFDEKLGWIYHRGCCGMELIALIKYCPFCGEELK